MALLSIASKFSSYLGRTTGSLFARYSSTVVAKQLDEEKETEKIINTVNTLAASNVSRNFAVVHLLGKQWKVTNGDLLMVEGNWPPAISDEIILDKVLLAGTKDFSLVGRPLVQPGLVKVTATIVSQNLSHTRTRFRKKRRKQFMRINFIRQCQTILRINTVEIGSHLNSSSGSTSS